MHVNSNSCYCSRVTTNNVFPFYDVVFFSFYFFLACFSSTPQNRIPYASWLATTSLLFTCGKKERQTRNREDRREREKIWAWLSFLVVSDLPLNSVNHPLLFWFAPHSSLLVCPSFLCFLALFLMAMVCVEYIGSTSVVAAGTATRENVKQDVNHCALCHTLGRRKIFLFPTVFEGNRC